MKFFSTLGFFGKLFIKTTLPTKKPTLLTVELPQTLVFFACVC